MRHSPAAAAVERAHADVALTVRCTHCGLASAWHTLTRTEVLEGAALSRHLAAPPDGWFVDVRACRGCGRPFARKVRTGRAAGE